MGILNDFIQHRRICISDEAKSTWLTGPPILHYHRICNFTILAKMLDKLDYKNIQQLSFALATFLTYNPTKNNTTCLKSCYCSIRNQ